MFTRTRSDAVRIATLVLPGVHPGAGFIQLKMRLLRKVKQVIICYPAVISGVFIYTYYMFTSIEWYRNWKMHQVEVSGWFSQFDALVWMWLLSFAFVKVLQLREQLHVQERKQLAQKNQLREKETGLRTLRTINLTLKDLINNPLAIIYAYLRRVESRHAEVEETSSDVKIVREAAERIHNVVRELDKVKEFKVTERSFGNLVEIGAEKGNRTN
ncbi:MAG TPA: hypothetical protein VIH68_06710 [Bacteroidota bacterium]